MYVSHFKCNIRTIRDGYPNINRWMRKLYWTIPAFKDTCNFAHIKTHYLWSHTTVCYILASFSDVLNRGAHCAFLV